MIKLHQRVEICGGIASGKTALASLLSEVNFVGLLEAFRENPFWQAFYAEPALYAFETEITFTLQHYHQIKKHSATSNTLVCDYSFLLDIAYAEMGLKKSNLLAFKTVYKEIQKEISAPSLIIHLQCDPATELARIHARGREVEKSITIDFLRSLNDAVSVQINKTRGHVPILTIDSAINNFVDDEDVKIKLLQMVADAIPQDK